MDSLLENIIRNVLTSQSAFCRFITGNDTGATGSHQYGYYIPKCAYPLLFDSPGIKGENKDRFIKIKWQNDFTTESRIIYYGKGSRNEYRITRFGRSFPFLNDENIGNLLIIARMSEDEYCGFVLNRDYDIDYFFDYFNLSANQSNQLISIKGAAERSQETLSLLTEYSNNYLSFPSTIEMAEKARECYNQAHNITDKRICNNPDDVILGWIDAEYDFFRILEEKIDADILSKPFSNIDDFIARANKTLNRRKSRAGKSLEHHLSVIFEKNNLIFEAQAVTENNKRPDFLFPNGDCYRNLLFPADDLTILGAKTTCKDRWRQVLTEADRVDEKYLFTLQQGVSSNQLKEMKDANLHLVVPKSNISCFPKEYIPDLIDLHDFIGIVLQKQEHISKYFII